MKIETKTTDNVPLCAPVLLFFPVSKEDVWILMWGRQQGVVPGRLRIPRYHFTSGQYAWEHSNVSYWACKVDVMLSAHTTHLLKVPISSHTHTHEYARTHNISYGVSHLFKIWAVTLSFTTLWPTQKSRRGRNERHNPTFWIIKHCCDSTFKVLFLMLFWYCHHSLVFKICSAINVANKISLIVSVF